MGYNAGVLTNPQPSIRRFAGAADAPSSVDNGNIVISTGAAPALVTLPLAAGELIALLPGFNANYIGKGAGLVSFAAGVGDSIYGYGLNGYFTVSPHAMVGQGAFVSVVLESQDPVTGVRVWALCGGLA